ncbi:hypothetical protein HPB50_018132 [Hyalomma asiaticum]|uniref:Uncharacterized protein n=1 Tax=Hyalomma asiaticum TaxID=266040 RepID=A0ACB7T5P3_HYAAI|nr:hypothetical protein HPB50_018132 [Hyalomma asiaticum]
MLSEVDLVCPASRKTPEVTSDAAPLLPTAEEGRRCMNVKDDRRLRKRRRGKYATTTEATLGTLNAPRSLGASEARGRKAMPFLAEVSARKAAPRASAERALTHASSYKHGV